MISDKAVIDPSVKMGTNVTVSHYAVIGPSVEIGDNTWIGPHAVIQGPTKLGKNNKIHPFASIGGDPQDKKYLGEQTLLEIGDNNTFRECITISRGTSQGRGITQIGHNNLCMAYVHIAHDCIVGSHTVFSNNASLAGHVIVEDYANLGGFVGVHQFCRIGKYGFCAAGSIVLKDVLPFITVSGYPAETYGLNVEGLKRQNFSQEEIINLKRAYKVLFRQGLTLEDAVKRIAETIPECPHVQSIVHFVKQSLRGITR